MNNYCDWKKWVNPLIPIHFFVQNVANDFVENITWQLSDSVGITYARRTVRIFTVSPQSCSLFSALFQTFCLTAQAYLNTQKYGLFRSLKWNKLFTINENQISWLRWSAEPLFSCIDLFIQWWLKEKHSFTEYCKVKVKERLYFYSTGKDGFRDF